MSREAALRIKHEIQLAKAGNYWESGGWYSYISKHDVEGVCDFLLEMQNAKPVKRKAKK